MTGHVRFKRAQAYARRAACREAALDEAERAAPSYALVHQYRANVAFLMGDTDAAIAAMEKAVQLEPDNALYRINLDRLRSSGAGEGSGGG